MEDSTLSWSQRSHCCSEDSSCQRNQTKKSQQCWSCFPFQQRSCSTRSLCGCRDLKGGSRLGRESLTQSLGFVKMPHEFSRREGGRITPFPGTGSLGEAWDEHRTRNSSTENTWLVLEIEFLGICPRFPGLREGFWVGQGITDTQREAAGRGWRFIPTRHRTQF